MSILKQNKRLILLYFLLGVVMFGNLGCASSNCSQPHPQKIVSETNEKLDVGEIAGNCFDRMFDIYEPVQGVCEMVLDTIDDSQVNYEPQNIVTLQQERDAESIDAVLKLLAHIANGGSFWR